MDWKEQLEKLRGTVPEAQEKLESLDSLDSLEKPEKPAKGRKLPLLRVELDKRRKGKVATLVTGHPGTDEEIQELARTLKTRLAVGGSTRDGEILLQGDIVQKTKELLIQLGYRA